MVNLKKGSKGNSVAALQTVIGTKADGIFGNNTRDALKAWQKEHGLTADGIAGVNTYRQIVAVSPYVRVGDSGKWAAVAEFLLTGATLDGVIKSDELAVIKTFQLANGLVGDGIIGNSTWLKLWGVTQPTAVNKKPVDYKQYDSRWASKVYTSTGNKSQTMKNSGCGATAAADVVATCRDASATPWTIAQLFMQYGFRTANSGTAWEAMAWTAKRYGFTKFVQTSSFATMRSCLASGGYVVVSFKKSKWTNGGHYCVLWKDDGKNIHVNDPASSSSSRAKGTYAEVQAAAKQYFCFWG